MLFKNLLFESILARDLPIPLANNQVEFSSLLDEAKIIERRK
jgi:hypothetical protein